MSIPILITTRTERVPGPTIAIDCPSCRAMGVDADSYEQTERLGFFYIIPFIRIRNTIIQCTACRKSQLLKIGIADIGRYSASELAQYFVGPVSFVAKFLAIASVILFWAPLLGIVVGFIALVMNWRNEGWPRVVSWLGVGLSVLVTVLLLSMFIVEMMSV